MVAVRPTFGKGGYYTTLRKQDSVLSWEWSTFEGGLGGRMVRVTNYTFSGTGCLQK